MIAFIFYCGGCFLKSLFENNKTDLLEVAKDPATKNVFNIAAVAIDSQNYNEMCREINKKITGFVCSILVSLKPGILRWGSSTNPDYF